MAMPLDGYTVEPLRRAETLRNFSCGDPDLDEFFQTEAFLYAKQLLGRMYLVTPQGEPDRIIGAFTVANDSIKSALIPKSTRNRIQRRIPNSKRTRSYPAILIGRLGAAEQGTGIGRLMLDYIKVMFSDDDNKSGCRFVVVDGYNHEHVLGFYERNGFRYLYATEEEERDSCDITPEERLHTRLMYFDLINME